jgi:succinyl-CoA synthetase beta subunit
MKIHEYQAKQLLNKFNVPLPVGQIGTAKEAAQVARLLGGNVCAVKAQIHAGGRDKGGEVKIAQSVKKFEA